MKSGKILLALLILATITFVTYSPCLKDNFVYWDEDQFLFKNPLIKNFSPAGLLHLFDPHTVGKSIPSSIYSSAASYIPLTLLSYWFEYHFFQFNPFVYHLDNIILHVFNVLLVFWLIYLSVEKMEIAFIAALLFGIVPLRVESVAWVMERKDVLFSCLYLGALVFYVEYVKRKTYAYFVGSVVLFIGSLFAKAQGLSFPFILLLFDYYFQRPWNKGLILEKLMFFFFNGLYWFFLLRGLYQVPLSFNGSILPLGCYTLVLYMIKSFIPFGITCLNPIPLGIDGLFSWMGDASIILVGAVGYFLYKYFLKARLIIFGVLFYLILMVLPILNMQFVQKTDIQFNRILFYDHYTYLPSIGLYFLFAWGLMELFNKTHLKSLQKVMMILIVVYALTMSILSFTRCKIWENGITLWSDVIGHAKTQDPIYSLAYINRGNLYSIQGRFQEAIDDYNAAIKLNPHDPESYANRGVVYGQTGQLPQALTDFNQAIELNPNFANAYYDRAITFHKLGEQPQAFSDYQRFQQLNS